MTGRRRPPDVDGFALVEQPADAAWRWPVYRAGVGPPVIVLQEVFGVTPEVLDFAGRLADTGFTVWLPVLGGPVPSTTLLQQADAIRAVCVSREIHVLRTGRTSPVVDPLRALARWVARAQDAAGVGVVGMCLSGGFALAMAADDAVLAAVCAQPSLPLVTPVTPWCARDAGLSPDHAEEVRERLRSGGVELFVTRFAHDRLSPESRVAAIRERVGSVGVTHDPVPAAGFRRNEHSVLTLAPLHYPDGSPQALRLEETAARVRAFLHRRLGGTSPRSTTPAAELWRPGQAEE